MKYILSLLTLVYFSSTSLAQYDDLKILFADANYEKLVKEASKYTEKDDTKKDPIPYYWLARGLYKVSLQGSDDENFKNAYKDAIGHLGKALKYDDDAMIMESFRDFVHEFQMSLVERINNDNAAGDSRKAYGWILKYKKATENNLGTSFMEGASKYSANDKAGAKTIWKTAEIELNTVTSLDGYSEADKIMLRNGIVQTAEAYIAMRQVDKAKELMGKVANWFEGDEEFQAKYDEIVN